MDYPNVRSSTICPLCGEEKEAGLIVCWACYRKHEVRYGNPEVESLLNHAENELAEHDRVSLEIHLDRRQ